MRRNDLMRCGMRCWVLAVLLAALCLPAAHARRLALVLGNNDYVQIGKLDNAGRDAESMAKELEAAGFDVTLRRDLSYRRMVVAFEEFFDTIKPGDELVVFYAGHGVQTERGAYLLPVDIEGDTASQIEKMSYAVNNLLEELDRIKSRMALVIVDACRDNPLRVRGRAVGAARGLSGPEVSKGQMVIFSAGRNQKALDSLGPNDKHPNGVFTRELLQRIRLSGVSIADLAVDLRDAVEKAALSVRHDQRPLIVSDLVGEFYFRPVEGKPAPLAAAVAAPAADTGSREDRFWDDAKAADNTEGFEAYLAAYPNGRYQGLAQAHIRRLASRPVASAQSSRSTGSGGLPQPAAAPAAPGAGATSPAAAPAAAATEARTAPAAAAPDASGAPPAPAVAAAPSASSAPPGSPVAAATLASAPATLPAPPPAPATPSTSGPRGRAAYVLPNGDRYEGEVAGSRRSGEGTYHFANGDRYVGQFVDDQFMGQGVMWFANGDRYEGLFNGTTKHGPGVMVFANKDRYVGDFVDNIYDGKGSFEFASGERYTGEYRRGLKQGHGEYLFANKDRYVGEFDNDKPHGKGVMFHANGDHFEGEYVRGVRAGAGVHKFANGDRFEGSFVAGLSSGRGRLAMANGDRYEGDFRDGLREGQGTYHFANKDRYEGGFAKGLEQGRGTYFYANGDRYEGEFAGGVRHGKGVHRFASGQSREVEYDKGVEKPR